MEAWTTGLGHTVVRFDAAELRIGGCRAYEFCYRTSKACTFDDDFNTIAPKVEEADAVVFASPVSWWGFSAQLKAMIDKLHSLHRAKEEFSGKTCAPIACAADAGDIRHTDGTTRAAALAEKL
ncbi:flavodoxin family protein [Fretibacterium sp. OH1220_COT-178]|uniref:flavodoxin family protein n=1 Tax=Fretibacterium sp. OH1220_COT-178 TaxID=2491047 RepID=UPI001315A6FC|nr:flavodoxin family protein [Fretibacterium sp. OH1220_COT-178]